MLGVQIFLSIAGAAAALALGLRFFVRRSRPRNHRAAEPIRPVHRSHSVMPEDRARGAEEPESSGSSGDGPPAPVSAPATSRLPMPGPAEAVENPEPGDSVKPVLMDGPGSPEPAQNAESGSSDGGSSGSVDVDVPAPDAGPLAIESLDDRSPSDAVELVPLDRPEPAGPAQNAEPGSSNGGNCAGTDVAVPSGNAGFPAIETLDNRSPSDAEVSTLPEDGSVGLPLAAEAPDAQPEEAASDPEMAEPAFATWQADGQRSGSGSAVSVEGEPLFQDGYAAQEGSAEEANESQPAETGMGVDGAWSESQVAEAAAAPEPESNAASTGDLAATFGDAGQSAPEGPGTAAATESAASGSAADPETRLAPAEPTEELDIDAVAMPIRRHPSRPAQHRDRRGQRRAALPPSGTGPKGGGAEAALRTPAEARLRLMIHPVRRSVGLAAVLARPPGYPERVTLLLGTGDEVGAYSEDRYDDVDLEWTPELLSGELRLDCEEGYQWLRSGRRVHIFAASRDGPGMISVGSAPTASDSTIVCLQDDEAVVRAAAAACGSPEMVSHEGWTGVPAGWKVLSGYRPVRASASPVESSLKALDPGIGAVIQLSGGLQVRSGSFAQGNPPRIEIEPFPVGSSVSIDGNSADMGEDGYWRAPGWDAPGDHLVDIVPGPSLTYRVIADPWLDGGWDRWDAHPERFAHSTGAPWERAEICGAAILGPNNEHVAAAETVATVIALGLRRGVSVLRARPDAPVSVGLLHEMPAFLVSSSGPRRTQGHIDWLAALLPGSPSREMDLEWAAAVRTAASRRLPLTSASIVGQESWRRARQRARRYRKAGR